MRAGLLATALVLTACAPAGPRAPAGPPPWQPEAGADPHWQEWFADQMAALSGADPSVVFIGDSITFAWTSTGAPSWARFAPYRPVNLGVPGDTSQNVLWRLGHGELDSLHPKVAVVMIGTNDLGSWTSAQVLKGIEAVVGATEQRLPAAGVVLMGLLPIDPPGTRRHQQVGEVDAALARRYASGPVRYLDLRPSFADGSGRLRAALYHRVCIAGTGFCDQLVHPSAAGYAVIADALAPVVASLIG